MTLDLDSYYDLTTVQSVAVSPNGERAAVLASESDAAADTTHSSLFVVPTDGGEPPTRLTRASDASAPTWSPDGSRLAFLATRDTDLGDVAGRGPDEDADEDEPTSQVWAFDLERGGDAEQVTDREYGVQSFDWGPDGDRLVVEARDPTDDEADDVEAREEGGPIEITRLQHKRDGVGWLDGVTTYLFLVDAETGEEERLDECAEPSHATPGGLAPVWGPNGTIAFTRAPGPDPDDEPAADLHLVDPDDGTPRRVTEDRRVSQPVFSPDGGRVAFAGGHPINWHYPTEVSVLDVETESSESVSATLDRTVGHAGGPFWTDAGLYTTIAADGQTTLYALDPDADDPTPAWPDQPDDTAVNAVDFGPAGAVVATSRGDAAPDLHAFDLDTAQTTRLTEFNPHLDAADLPTTERVHYENESGDAIEAIAYLPPGFDPDDPEPAPTIAYIHGGPMSYDEPEFRFDRAYWASQGYLVVCPNYRGSTSYGADFSVALRGQRGGLESEDVLAGLDELVARDWTDPERQYLTGFSYGGITTANVLARTDRFAAAAAEHGIYDLYSNFGTDDNHLWHEDEWGLPWEHPETYREASSITRVGEMHTPLLVTAGEEDWRCPPTQAEQLYVSLKKQGVDAKLVIYQNEHHNIGDPTRATHRMQGITDWFDAHQ